MLKKLCTELNFFYFSIAFKKKAFLKFMGLELEIMWG